MTTHIPRIDLHSARESVESGEALLVCAYDDEEKCRSLRIEGALTLQEFEDRRVDIDHRQRIILYCA